jgi:hypothetical protein
MTQMIRSVVVVLPLLLLVVGCAKYEYDIVRPPEFAQHVGPSTDVSVRRDPL